MTKKPVVKTTKNNEPKPKKLGGVTGKGFMPNNPITGEKDPKINRRGRPTKDQIGERELWQNTFAEYLYDDQGKVIMDDVSGKPLTRLQARIRVATSSRNPSEFENALNRAYGKITEETRSLSVIDDFILNNIDLFTDGQIQRIQSGEDKAAIVAELMRDTIKNKKSK